MKTKMLALLLCASGVCFAQSYEFSTLINFSGGSNPGYISNVIIDTKGNLYGVSEFGGTYSNGVVFEVSPKGALKILHSFKGAPTDGYLATGNLVRDKSGNFYGTSQYGGSGTGCHVEAGCGTIFKLTPAGKETVLYNFQGGADGDSPVSGMARDSSGNLYGVSYDVSSAPSYISFVFKLTPANTFSTLESFDCFLGGAYLLIVNQSGDLFGSACVDTATPFGSVFELTPTNQLSTLYTFTGGSDGAIPTGKLTQDAKGNLYGSAANNGAFGGGVVFKIDPSGAYSVLYSFCALASCADGSTPTSWITLDSTGNLYGTTEKGGTTGNGVVFRIAASGVETVLYTFENATQNPSNQETGLVLDAAGNLYASTYSGGKYGVGSIYKLTKQ